MVRRKPANAPSAHVHGRRSLTTKRVIGVPGDRVRIEEGQGHVNDVAIDQGFITAAGTVGVQPVDFPEAIGVDGAAEALVVGFNDALTRASTPLLTVDRQ